MALTLEEAAFNYWRYPGLTPACAQRDYLLLSHYVFPLLGDFDVDHIRTEHLRSLRRVLDANDLDVVIPPTMRALQRLLHFTRVVA